MVGIVWALWKIHINTSHWTIPKILILTELNVILGGRNEVAESDLAVGKSDS